jgi:hypothetical protein
MVIHLKHWQALAYGEIKATDVQQYHWIEPNRG